MKQLRTSVILAVLLLSSSVAARADVVLDWNAIAVETLVSQGQNPFAQARFMSITQLAVFEAVNRITATTGHTSEPSSHQRERRRMLQQRLLRTRS
jgi:hypothetical protein